jgi:phosphodiesterase/alkaline phosphatase D-like protein
MKRVRKDMRSLTNAVALMVLAIICIGGIAGTALASPFVANEWAAGVSASYVYAAPSGGFAVNAPVISDVSASNVAATSATITWTTDELATSQVDYGLTAAYGSTAALLDDYVLSHSVDLTGLTPETLYHYRVLSTGLFDDGTTESEDYTFTTAADDTGPVISNVTAVNITATSATITWTTDEPATSLVEYGKKPSYGSTASALGLVTDHSVNLTGLTAQTTYYYRVNSTDASGNSSPPSERFSFDTLDVAGPLFYDIKATDVTETSVTIIWSTSEEATSQVEYGLTSSYGSKTPLDPALVMSHSVAISGLSPKTVYYYRVNSRDASGNPSQSGGYMFATLDLDAPVISGVAATNVSGTSATITWTTDDPAQSQVEYGESPSYGLTTPLYELYVIDHSVNLTGLNSQTTYYYKVKSRDDSGLWSVSEDFTFTTVDITAPAISGAVATDISSTAANIIWTTNEAATSLVEYGTTASYGSTTSHDMTLVLNHKAHLSGLKSRTTYHYRVKSRDAVGLWTESADLTFTTTDVNAPVISNVAATNVTGTDATITWTTDDAAESQVEYGTSIGYGLTTALDTNRVTKHSVYLTDLSPQVTYHYKVKSRDASGFWAESVDYTFTTGADPGGIPPTIILAKAFNMSGSGATIAWETNRETTSLVEYGLTTEYGKTTILDVSLERYHTVNLKGLEPNKTYHYRVISTDAFGNQAQSEDLTFDTTIGKAPSLNLPIWAWAVIGTTVALVVGTMVIREV